MLFLGLIFSTTFSVFCVGCQVDWQYAAVLQKNTSVFHKTVCLCIKAALCGKQVDWYLLELRASNTFSTLGLTCAGIVESLRDAPIMR